MSWSTPVYVGYGGVVDQIDLNHHFYWDYVRYASLPGQTPWEAATPIAYSYGPRKPPQMPPVH